MSFTGVAVEFTPTPHFEPSTVGKSLGIGGLIGPIVGLRRAACQVLAITLLLELLAALLPQFSQFVIDDVLVTSDVSLLNSLFAGFMLMIFSYAAVNFARSWFLLRWSVDINLQWATRVFAHLLRLPVEYFEKRQLGDIASRFDSISAMQNTITSLFVESVLDAGLALLMFILMWVYSPMLMIAVLLPLLLYAGVRATLYRALENVSRDCILLRARESSYFLETIRSMTSVRLFGCEAIRGARWLNLKQDVANAEIKKQRLQSIAKTSNVALFAIQSVLLFYTGAFLVAGQQLTVGMLIAFSTYATVFSARSCKMIDLIAEWRMLDMHRERLAGIVEEPIEALRESSVDISTLAPRISLKGVSFRYAESDPWIIDNVNLTIESGQSVVLVGASGCGKTTLCKLLLGLLRPTQGEVLLDNVAITELGLRQYRQLLGTVMQDDTLFSGSIADNITFFDPYPDPQRIETCAHQAAIHEEIVAMPMAYHTLIGEMGSVLSGGQKQRILLARALYKQPRILALDEATSHLDAASEYRVNDAVRQLDLTRIMVAHRIETIATAERVLEVNGGKVIEHPPLKLAAVS
ncbi:MAG: peptidase domain-containing ABC transporter [Burkholderiaceae bacterium]|nr:peptidase domain-containing ABC transporter [Burkholderiaceae bacterium]